MANGTEVVTTGLANITAAMLAYANAPSYIGWGTGTTTPATGDTDLESPGTHEDRTAGTDTQQTTTTSNDTYQTVGTITCLTSGKAITEVGTFDAAGSGNPPSGGNLCVHSVFDVINVGVDSSIEFTVKTTLVDNS